MKRGVYFLSVLILGLVAIPTFTRPVSALTITSPYEATTIPTPAEITASLQPIFSLEHYSEYQKLTPSVLESTTPFYREYRYLFALVDTANSLLDHYDTADPDNLRDIVAAARDAYLACSLRFQAAREYAARQSANTVSPSTSLTTPDQSTPQPAASVTTPSYPRTTTSVAINTAPSSPSSETTPASSISETQTPSPVINEDTSTPYADVEVPLTSNPETDSPTPLSLRLAFAVTAVSAILALIIVSLVRLNSHSTSRVSARSYRLSQTSKRPRTVQPSRRYPTNRKF